MTAHSLLNSFWTHPTCKPHAPRPLYILFPSLFPPYFCSPGQKLQKNIRSYIPQLSKILKQIKTKVSVQRKSHQFFCCIWLIHREMIAPVHGTSRAGCSGAGRLLSKSVRLHPGTSRFRFYRRWPPRRRPPTIKI